MGLTTNSASSLMTVYRLCIYSLLLVTWPTLSWSEQAELTTQCPASDSSLNYTAPPVFTDDNIEKINVSAEQVKNIDNTISAFSGNVLIERHLLRLRADEVLHDQQSQRLDLSGNIHADTESMSLSADSGWLNLESGEGELYNSHYYMVDSQLNGKTPLFSLGKNDLTVLQNTQFSSCPEQQMDWYLNMSSLELDQLNATGTATHTVLWIKDVPVFYLPWIQFPLGEERRSGLLMPGFGSSSSSGFEYSQPWYWNIAANHDATLTPRYYRKRGSMLQTEYRFLTQQSAGEFNIEYLENDKLLDEERYLLKLNNRNKLGEHLQLNLIATDASDSDYLKDFGNNISLTNTTHLQKQAQLRYFNSGWNSTLTAQAYETIDQTIAIENRPYRRLPQLSLRGRETLVESDMQSLDFNLNAEWVDFEHESDTKTQGARTHFYPRFSVPMQGNAWFLKPAAGFMYTRYDITDSLGNSIDIQERQLSVSSIDSGLFFEREIGDGSFIQTLEPRLYYLHIPYEDQSGIPLFDTSEQSFGFSSLFRENRFNGIDRVGDANQATFAISSRLLDIDDGSEMLNLSLGRIYYFDDQQVSLDNSINQANSSDIIGEISGQYQNWKARSSVQWDRKTEQADKRSFQLNYAASNDAVFNLGYRFRRDSLDENNNIEQTDVSFAWPFARNYSMLSRWNYSITRERDIETLFGIQYESCCWAIRLITQRYLTDNISEPYDSSIMFQFVLKGFGSISDKAATETLKHAILGYQPDY